MFLSILISCVTYLLTLILTILVFIIKTTEMQNLLKSVLRYKKIKINKAHKFSWQRPVYTNNINLHTVRSLTVESVTCIPIHSQSWHLYANLIICSKDSQM